MRDLSTTVDSRNYHIVRVITLITCLLEPSMCYFGATPAKHLCSMLQTVLLLGLWFWEKKFGPTPMWGQQPGKSTKIHPELVDSDDVFLRNDVVDSNERTPLLLAASTTTVPKVYVPNGSTPQTETITA